MIALVTETLCCMDPSDCAAYGVHLIPLSCALGEETLLDRLLLREESIPDGKGYSIPPSEELYRERFETLLQTHDGVNTSALSFERELCSSLLFSVRGLITLPLSPVIKSFVISSAKAYPLPKES